MQYALGDAVAVGDAKGVFELVSRLVQEGQDLRFVTNEVLAHFRNLLLVKTAPGQHDLLDVTDQEAERLAAQATKYSAAELGRVIALLIAAQTDMRWTTSPRLSLELALIRATIPETDAAPEALVSRLERLERVAGITGGGGGSGAAGSRLRLAAADHASAAAPAPRAAAPSRLPPTTPAPPPPATPPTDAAVAGGPAAAGTGDAADSAPPAVARRRTRSAKGAEASGAAEAAPGPAEAGTAPEPAPAGARVGGGDVGGGRDDAAEQLADGDLAPAELGEGGAALVPRDRDARVVRRDDARARVPARATRTGSRRCMEREGGAPAGAPGPVRHHAGDHAA